MNILVIGGTRYFGRYAVQRLLDAGHEVTVYSRGNVKPAFWNEIEHIRGDRDDAETFIESLRGRKFDGVIDNQCHTRANAAAAIQALRGSVGRYVVSSTVSIYAANGHAAHRSTARMPLKDEEHHFVDTRIHDPVRESDAVVANQPWEYRPYLNPYAEGKRMMERAMLESPGDWPWLVVRVPSTLGPDEPNLRLAWWLTRILDGGPVLVPNGGLHAFQVGYAPDLANFLIRALSAPGAVRQIYNFAQSESPSFVYFLQAVADAAGRSLNAVSVPAEILHNHSGLPWEEYLYAPFSHRDTPVVSLTKVERDIGLENTPLLDWITETTDWYAGNPDALKQTRFQEMRPLEVEFAGRWQRAYDGLKQAFS